MSAAGITAARDTSHQVANRVLAILSQPRQLNEYLTVQMLKKNRFCQFKNNPWALKSVYTVHCEF